MSENTLGRDLAHNPPIPEESGRQLEALAEDVEALAEDGWKVIHGVPLGPDHEQIEHLVIGPAGVFTIFCRAHPKQRVDVYPLRITVDGEPVTHLHDARVGAMRAKRILDRALGWSVPVRPALGLYTDSRLPKVSIHDEGPLDVLVLYRSGVGRQFKKMNGLLEPHQVEEIYAKARWSENWVVPESL